jgi:DNA-binding CsgD family transcriptional regulator
LWARLSVFAGGFELDAAEGICADDRLAADDVLELLAGLAGKSVLIAEHSEGVARCRLPEPLREYGQERLHESGEDTALRRRHRDWHEQLARRADTDWLSSQAADLAARLFREHANVAAAQDFCQAEPGEAEAGLRIALHVWPFYYWTAGHVSEGRYRIGQALARAGEPTVWRARGLLLASLLAAVSGDRGAALPLLEQGTGLAGQLNDPATSAFAACVAGYACLFAGDLPQAIAHCEDGLGALPAAAVPGRLRVYLLINLAVAAGLAGDEERAAACHRELAALTAAGAFQAAYRRGLELPADDALAYALQQPLKQPPAKPPAPAVSGEAPLTPRELQVARLVAGGRSNKEIAAELVIAPRTAEGHVERILTKLGFTSRAQLAAWVAASQPGGKGRSAAPDLQTPVDYLRPLDESGMRGSYRGARERRLRGQCVLATLTLLIQAGMGIPRRAWREKCS